MNEDVTPLIIKTSKVSTFSCIRKTVLDDFEAARRDNEILRTSFANHHSGEHHFYFFFLTENDIWPLTRRNDFGDASWMTCKNKNYSQSDHLVGIGVFTLLLLQTS